jgi:YVTN family beta-propeller protein
MVRHGTRFILTMSTVALAAACGHRTLPVPALVTDGSRGVESTLLEGTPFAVAVSPTGVAYVTLAHTETAVRIDLPTMRFSEPFSVGSLPSQVRFSPDGKTAYVANQDLGAITFVTVATNEVSARLTLPGGSILNIGLAPDGRRLYALTDYRGVHVIDTDERTVIGTIPATRTGVLLTGVGFHPSAPRMYVSARDEGRIVEVDLRSQTVVRTLSVPGSRIQNLAVSGDGARLFATDIQRSKLLVWNLRSNDAGFIERAVGTAQDRNAFDVAVTPDNQQVYVSTLADGVVYIFDAGSLEQVTAITTGGTPRYVAFDSKGRTAVIANESGWVSFVR